MEVRESLYECIVLEMHNIKWTQKLDYWKLPFCCFLYRQVGHLAQDCSSLDLSRQRFKNVWIKKSSSVSVNPSSSELPSSSAPTSDPVIPVEVQPPPVNDLKVLSPSVIGIPPSNSPSPSLAPPNDHIVKSFDVSIISPVPPLAPPSNGENDNPNVPFPPPSTPVMSPSPKNSPSLRSPSLVVSSPCPYKVKLRSGAPSRISPNHVVKRGLAFEPPPKILLG